MASNSQALLDSIDALFARVKPYPGEDVLGSVLSSSVPQEQAPGNIQVQPSGWVKNADASSGIATVTIDGAGITILNGKIFLSDYTGSSVLGPAGFDGSWIEFVTRGTYNAEFNSGYDLGAGRTGTTIVGTAGTAADYLASMSPYIPFWGVQLYAGDLTYGVDYSGALGYYLGAFEAAGSGTETNVEFFQDVPVVPGHYYSVETRQYGGSTGGTDVVLQVAPRGEWRDADHAWISNQPGTDTTGSIIGGSTMLSVLPWVTSARAPEDARFLRVIVQLSITADTGASDIYIALQSVSCLPVPSFGRYEIPFSSSILGTDMGLYPRFIQNGPTMYDYALFVETQGLGMAVDLSLGPSDLSYFKLMSGSTPDDLWQVDENGHMSWADGAGGSFDTQLSRAAAGALQLQPTTPGYTAIQMGDVSPNDRALIDWKSGGANILRGGVFDGASFVEGFRVDTSGLYAANGLRVAGGMLPGTGALAATVAPNSSSYPDGLSMFVVSADASWPSSYGMVWTFKYSTRVMQYYYTNSGSALYFRGASGSSWLGWQQVAAATWTAVSSFSNSWANYGSGFANAAYMIDGHGTVHLRGMIKSGTVGSSAFTLPSGYRPAATTLCSTISNGAVGRVDVKTDGTVVPSAPSSNAWVSLEGIVFSIY